VIKLGFSTQSVEGWPPFEIEYIWLSQLGDDLYRVENTPFFVKGLCYEDELYLFYNEENFVVSWSIKNHSLNSTVWMMELKKNAAKKIVTKLRSLGCNIEEGIPRGYYSICIPNTISIILFDDEIGSYVSKKRISISYSSLRH